MNTDGVSSLLLTPRSTVCGIQLELCWIVHTILFISLITSSSFIGRDMFAGGSGGSNKMRGLWKVEEVNEDVPSDKTR